MRRVWAQLFIVSVFCLAFSAGVFAQATSQISGTVKDASGAVIAGAQVTVTQTDTQFTRTATSDANGVYSLPDLPLGPYQLQVKKEGFNTYVQTGILLQVGSAVTANPVLQVGSVAQSVQVEGVAAPMNDTTTTGVGQVVNSQSVVDLPLNGRQVTQLITLAGASNPVQYGFGGTPSVGNLISSKSYPNEMLTSVAGGMLNGTLYLMDGGTFNDPFNNLNLPTPFPDAIQEFNVQTSAIPAQYGQHSGGAINIATKQGTNQFHGDAFEFVRNSDFNAKDYFSVSPNAPNGLSDGLKRNQFGGTIGGPIKKDKLFFFLGYQGTMIRQKPPANKAVLPTPSELQGNFSNYLSAACFGSKIPTLTSAYTNNQLNYAVPAIVTAFASHFPVGPEPCGNVTYQVIANQNEHMGIGRVDYQINSKQTLFVRYFGTHSLVPSSFTGNELTVVNAGTDDMVNSLVVGHTYLVNSAMVNSFHFTYNTDGITKFQVPIVSPADLGIPDMYISAAPFVHYSNINITGDFQSAGGFATPGLDNTHTWQLADDYSWNKGAHQIQFGASFIRPSQTSTFCVYCNGLFTFSGSATGTAMSDFIAGALDGMTQLNISHDDENWRSLGIYAQDSWKINSRLTLNYGLRWEPYLAGSFPLGQVSHFDMSDFVNNVHSTIYPNAPAGTLYPGDPGFQTGGRPNNTTWNNWAPRIGVAWDPTGSGKTLIRASWGILYDMPQTLFYYNYAGEPLWGETINIPLPGAAACLPAPAVASECDTFANPWASYPGGSPFPVKQNTSSAYPIYSYYESVPLHVHNTYMEQWNLTIQRQVGTAWLLKASYLGNDMVHLWMDQELNPGVYITPTNPLTGGCTAPSGATLTPCDTSSALNVDERRLFWQLNPSQAQYYGTVENLNDGGTGSYNALLLSAEHRFSDHFQMLANYTWSHCIADLQTTELSGPIYTNPADPRFDRGNCAYVDIHHNFNLNAVLQSPHFSSRMLQWIAGDWQLSPIFSAHTGSYFTITMGGADSDIAATGIGGQRPNQVLSNPYCTPKGAATCWINAAAFAPPGNGIIPLPNGNPNGNEAGAFGNEGVNNLEGPGYFDVDFALSRRFPITERQAIEIRWETFNVENRVNLLNPGTAGIAAVGTTNTVTGSSTFGQISSDVSPRIMQFALKYFF